MDIFILDIWKIIFELLDFKSKLNLISTCKYLRHQLHITDLYYIDKKYLYKLTTEILQYSIFDYVLWLDTYNNYNITNISFMKHLEKLNAGNVSRIDQNLINRLDLIELTISFNNKIKDISFMKNLKN
jgi:hypothetical protein